MAKAPFPERIPGEIFLLEWDRDRDVFVLHVDDANYSSFNLGSDIQQIMQRFKMWDLEETGYAAIDLARSFGAAKAHIPTGRTAAVFARDDERKLPPMFKENEDEAHAGSVLRPHM